MEVDRLDNSSSTWLNELSNVITNGLGEVRECKIVIDYINTNLSILKFITPLIKALRSQKLRQRHYDDLTKRLNFEVNSKIWKYYNVKFLISKQVMHPEV